MLNLKWQILHIWRQIKFTERMCTWNFGISEAIQGDFSLWLIRFCVCIWRILWRSQWGKKDLREDMAEPATFQFFIFLFNPRLTVALRPDRVKRFQIPDSLWILILVVWFRSSSINNIYWFVRNGAEEIRNAIIHDEGFIMFMVPYASWLWGNYFSI